jgi:hypothetical protein
MSDIDLDELDALRDELDDFAAPKKAGGRSAREERIIAGFEEIQRFADQHGRAPQHGDGRDIVVKDRFGQPVIPREWFLVPLFAIDEAIDRIKNGTITGYVYDPEAAALVHADKA